MDRRNAVKILPLAAMGFAGAGREVKASKEDTRPLCLQYLDRVRDTFEKIRSTESDKLLEAAFLLAQTYKNGGTCYGQCARGTPRHCLSTLRNQLNRRVVVAGLFPRHIIEVS